MIESRRSARAFRRDFRVWSAGRAGSSANHEAHAARGLALEVSDFGQLPAGSDGEDANRVTRIAQRVEDIQEVPRRRDLFVDGRLAGHAGHAVRVVEGELSVGADRIAGYA